MLVVLVTADVGCRERWYMSLQGVFAVLWPAVAQLDITIAFE